jgi:hypothetical protein
MARKGGGTGFETVDETGFGDNDLQHSPEAIAAKSSETTPIDPKLASKW